MSIKRLQLTGDARDGEYLRLVELGREHDKSDLKQQQADIDAAIALHEANADDEDDPGSLRMLNLQAAVEMAAKAGSEPGE